METECKNQPRNTLTDDLELRPDSVLTKGPRKRTVKPARSLSESINETTLDVTRTRKERPTDVTAKSTMSS